MRRDVFDSLENKWLGWLFCSLAKREYTPEEAGRYIGWQKTYHDVIRFFILHVYNWSTDPQISRMKDFLI
jgi:hypothetical protein